MVNNISFKGLYVLTGKPENARTENGKAISEIRMSKLEGFLSDTKPYRKEDDVSYYNEQNGDYYMTVKPECEADFEDEVEFRNLDCVKVGSEAVSSNANVKKEVNFIEKMIYSFKKCFFKNIDKNIIYKEKINSPIKKEINIPKY